MACHTLRLLENGVHHIPSPSLFAGDRRKAVRDFLEVRTLTIDLRRVLIAREGEDRRAAPRNSPRPCVRRRARMNSADCPLINGSEVNLTSKSYVKYTKTRSFHVLVPVSV